MSPLTEKLSLPNLYSREACPTSVQVFSRGCDLGSEISFRLQPREKYWTLVGQSLPAIGSSQFTATHAALSIPLEQSQIESIAQREGWRCLRCSRGHFEIIEFWVENSLLLELATPELAEKYTAVLAPENLAQHFGEEKS